MQQGGVGGEADSEPTDLAAFQQQMMAEVDARIADVRADRHMRGGPANTAMRMPGAAHGNQRRVFVKPSALRRRPEQHDDVRAGCSANPVMATKLPHTSSSNTSTRGVRVSDPQLVEGLPGRPHIAFGRVTVVRTHTAAAAGATRPPTRTRSTRSAAHSHSHSHLPTLHHHTERSSSTQMTRASRGALTPLVDLLPNGALPATSARQ